MMTILTMISLYNKEDFYVPLRWVDKDDLNVWEDNWDDDNIDDDFSVQ